MKKELLELSTIEFCRILLDFPEAYTLDLSRIDKDGEEHQIVGTYDQLIRFFKSNGFQVGIEYVEKNLFDYSNEIGETEQFEFLYTKTHEFNERFCKVMYDEMEFFYHMFYTEEINAEVQKKYIDEGWEIPISTHISTNSLINLGVDKDIIIPDYDKMREKVYPCRQWSFDKVMRELKKHINPSLMQYSVEAKNNENVTEGKSVLPQMSHALAQSITNTFHNYNMIKKEFSLIYLVVKANINENTSMQEILDIINESDVPNDKRPKISSLKALTTHNPYPNWKILGASIQEMERYNEIAEFFLDEYNKLTKRPTKRLID